MPVTVRIPTALRKLAGGNETVKVAPGTVRAGLAELAAVHPALTSQLLDPSGNLRSFVNLFANDDSVRELDGLDTVLSDGDELSIVPAIAGG
jgi:molybdopterin synthase sulfur carrier subunit